MSSTNDVKELAFNQYMFNSQLVIPFTLITYWGMRSIFQYEKNVLIVYDQFEDV